MEIKKLRLNAFAMAGVLLASLPAVSNASSLTSAATSSSMPAGAVVAFNSVVCPDGWTQYTRAAGRTIIGMGTYSESFRGKSFSTFYGIGFLGGTVSYTLNEEQMPRHRHTDIGRHLGDADGSPSGQGWSGSHWTGWAGGSQPFDNRQPWVSLLYCEKQ